MIADPLAHLRQWLDRAMSEYGPPDPPVVRADAFVEKIRRVLDGENTIGIAPCRICGRSDTDRTYFYEEFLVEETAYLNDVCCDSHHPRARYVCPCGNNDAYWCETADSTFAYTTKDEASTFLCTGCGNRLPTSADDRRTLLREMAFALAQKTHDEEAAWMTVLGLVENGKSAAEIGEAAKQNLKRFEKLPEEEPPCA